MMGVVDGATLFEPDIDGSWAILIDNRVQLFNKKSSGHDGGTWRNVYRLEWRVLVWLT